MTDCATVTDLRRESRHEENRLRNLIADNGKCVGDIDDERWFPATATAEQAEKACAGCPVRRQCLELAFRKGEQYGILGGTTPEQRAEMLGLAVAS